MKLKYTALGANSQKLEGVLEAESVDAAREELHKMGLSIIGINEISEEEFAAESQKAPQTQGEAGIITYYFLAKDAQQKEVNGTIDSKDAYSAFRRLMTEYHFEVVDLYPQSAADPAAESSKSQFEQWKKALEEEGVDLTQKPASGAKNELEEEGEKMSEEIVTEMDQFIINTKKIMSDHRDQYSEAFFKEIEKKLDELERIRASNNLKHITKVCNDLYELISNPDAQKVTPQGEVDKDYADTVSRLKGSGFIANRFQFLQAHSLQKKAQRFARIQKMFTKILKMVNRSKAGEIDARLEQKVRGRQAKWLSRLTSQIKGEGKESAPSFMGVIRKFFAFVGAGNTIMRRAKKQEMIKSYNEWKAYKKEAKARKAAGKAVTEGEVTGRDFSGFFMELDSFVGWLLFFYIAYFFLVSFAIEKNIGLPKELVMKTLASPLIINISIFLLFAHLAFTLKVRLFRANFLGSLFLFFLSFGIYTILMVNF